MHAFESIGQSQLAGRPVFTVLNPRRSASSFEWLCGRIVVIDGDFYRVLRVGSDSSIVVPEGEVVELLVKRIDDGVLWKWAILSGKFDVVMTERPGIGPHEQQREWVRPPGRCFSIVGLDANHCLPARGQVPHQRLGCLQ